MKKVKEYLKRLFIDGLSGMATGLFATLIIGTIIAQIGSYIPGKVGELIVLVGKTAQFVMGAGIGAGVAIKYKQSPLVTISAAVCGMVGAYASQIIAGTVLTDAGLINLRSPGEPLGAFIAAYVGIELGRLVSGKTKVDIIVTPLVSIATGSAIGLLIGPPVSAFMSWLGGIINWAAVQHPFVMGIVISVLMGMFLTLPISSAAIGVSLGLSGIAAGAATVGCCANMIGFAVISFRENKFGGLISQGIGTSMLQMPNIIKNPRIWIPAILSSAILGPVSTLWVKMQGNPIGSGMGTSGLIGPIMSFTVMTGAEVGEPVWLVIIKIAMMYFILPAALSLGISELMRKLKWIKPGDLSLSV
ncbi:MAG: PTS sugar transporter subunit IIC [Clostridia bacterium]|nr:PTS sugar transporter subunit IIC [Clostridia bacterium]